MPKGGVETKEVEKKETELEVIPQVQSVEVLIAKAIDNGLTAETMEKFLAMRRELKQEFAREEFIKAMSAFQAECPIVKRSKDGGKVKETGKVAYRYAPIEEVASDEIRKLIAKNGLSYTMRSGHKDGKFFASCVVSHIAGHSEETVFEVSAATKTGVMSEAQAEAAAMMFATRYAFRNAFGIIVGGDDDEDVLAEDQLKQLEDLKKENDKDFIHFRSAIENAKDIESLGVIWETIPATMRVHLVSDKEKAKVKLGVIKKA
jgi:hypothetical protein